MVWFLRCVDSGGVFALTWYWFGFDQMAWCLSYVQITISPYVPSSFTSVPISLTVVVLKTYCKLLPVFSSHCLFKQRCSLFSKGHSVPVVLQSTFHAQACEELFKHLCISGTPKIRLHTGLLLVQLCGGERWWGQFLSNVLQELYNSEQLLIFPQDR